MPQGGGLQLCSSEKLQQRRKKQSTENGERYCRGRFMFASCAQELIINTAEVTNLAINI